MISEILALVKKRPMTIAQLANELKSDRGLIELALNELVERGRLRQIGVGSSDNCPAKREEGSVFCKACPASSSCEQAAKHSHSTKKMYVYVSKEDIK